VNAETKSLMAKAEVRLGNGKEHGIELRMYAKLNCEHYDMMDDDVRGGELPRWIQFRTTGTTCAVTDSLSTKQAHNYHDKNFTYDRLSTTRQSRQASVAVGTSLDICANPGL